MATLPMFHIFGLTLCLTMSALAGATVVLVPKFDVDLVLDAARKSKPTIFPGVPPMYQRIIESPRIRKANLRSIRTCVSGAMKLPRETVDGFRRATGGGQLVQGYGLTESSPVVMANPLDGNARHISVGIPVPSTYARIVREDNPRSAALIGEAGELLVAELDVVGTIADHIEVHRHLGTRIEIDAVEVRAGDQRRVDQIVEGDRLELRSGAGLAGHLQRGAEFPAGRQRDAGRNGDLARVVPGRIERHLVELHVHQLRRGRGTGAKRAAVAR